jgi:anti-sigma B factor antagonist
MECKVKMKSSYHQDSDVHIVNIYGEIDLYQAPRLRNLLLSILITGEEKLVVDLSDVEFMDSSGLGAITAAFSRLRKSGGKLKIAGAAGIVKKVFEITNMHTFFDMYESSEEALQSYRFEKKLNTPV